ncbi:MAG: hypothetical protein IMZ53_06240 [Thermoplasmata archaeon]|nr:hypothetical protein [Thermoplasmata archaeon]
MTDPEITKAEKFGGGFTDYLDGFGQFLSRKQRQADEAEQEANDREWEDRHEQGLFE